MYTYLSSRVLPKQIGAQWKDADIGEKIVREIYSENTEIYLRLMQDDLEVVVDFNQMRSRYATYNNKLSVLLQVIGDEYLETVDSFPNGVNKYAVYQNATRVGYSVKLGEKRMYRTPGYPRDLLPDLEISRDKYPTDITLVHTHCLLSVNGMYHQTESDGERTWIVDGAKSLSASNHGHVGILSFRDIGQVEKTPIAVERIEPSRQGGTLYEGLTIHVDRPVTGAFILVLGGFLTFQHPDVFWQISETSFGFRMDNFRYLEKMAETLRYLDVSGLQLAQSPIHDQLLNVEELTSDSVIRRYFGLSQSFFVTIDADSLFVNKKFLRKMNAPGIFTAYQEPTGPLVTGSGRVAEYWKVKEAGYWSVSASDSFYRDYIFDREQRKALKNFTPTTAFDRPFFYSQGMMLEIGSFRKNNP